MRTKKILGIYIFMLTIMLAPVVSAIIAMAVAGIAGSQLDEGSSHRTLFLGRDVGNIVYAMFVFGWLGIATIPSGIVGIVTFTFFIVRERRKKLKNADPKQASSAPTPIIDTPEMAPDIMRDIRNAAGVGVIAAGYLILLIIPALINGAWNRYFAALLLWCLLLAGLSYGTWRRIRVCAFSLVLAFAGWTIVLTFARGHMYLPLPVAIGTFFSALGARAVVRWHRLKAA